MVHDTSHEWQRVVDDLKALQARQEIPERLLSENAAKAADDFDVMDYFKVLKHL